MCFPRRTAVRGSIAAALLSSLLAAFPAVSQPPDSERAEAGFNDPEFWRIVESGPADSAELELAVSTYATNGMADEVVRLFARYLRQAERPADPYCGFCQSLLPSNHGYSESELTGLFFDASDLVVAQSIESGSSDALIRLAVISSASSVREHRDRALYFLTAAAQVGIEDSGRFVVVQTLANLGFKRDALAIAESAFGNPGSAHHQSEDLAKWIGYLRNQIDRDEQIGGIIATAAIR